MTLKILIDMNLSPVVSILKEYESELKKGALIVLDDRVNRVRILPLR